MMTFCITWQSTSRTSRYNRDVSLKHLSAQLHRRPLQADSSRLLAVFNAPLDPCGPTDQHTLPLRDTAAHWRQLHLASIAAHLPCNSSVVSQLCQDVPAGPKPPRWTGRAHGDGVGTWKRPMRGRARTRPIRGAGGPSQGHFAGGGAQILPTAGHSTSGGEASQGALHGRARVPPRCQGVFAQTSSLPALRRSARRGGYAGSGQERSL